MVILDWEMPILSGAKLVRIVRSPGAFRVPDIPIIMLTGHRERWRVVEAVRLGVNEYLTKPISSKALYDRLVSVTMKPRAAVQIGDYYGPAPRKLMPIDNVRVNETGACTHKRARAGGLRESAPPRKRTQSQGRRDIAGGLDGCN